MAEMDYEAVGLGTAEIAQSLGRRDGNDLAHKELKSDRGSKSRSSEGEKKSLGRRDLSPSHSDQFDNVMDSLGGREVNDSLIQTINEMRKEVGSLREDMNNLKRKRRPRSISDDSELEEEGRSRPIPSRPSGKKACRSRPRSRSRSTSRSSQIRSDEASLDKQTSDMISIHADEDYMLSLNEEEEEASDIDDSDDDILNALEKEIEIDQHKGPNLDNKLAKVVASRFSKRLEENVLKTKQEKYKVPGNCTIISPPILNEELMQSHIGLKRGAKRDDARTSAVQRLITKATTALALGVGKLHEFADKFSGSGKQEMKKLANEVMENSLDACAFLGHAQQDLSLRRKFQLMRELPSDIRTICYQKTNGEDSEKLFGEDINKTMKEAREAHRLNQSKMQKSGYGRRPFLGGRGRGFPTTSTNQYRAPYMKKKVGHGQQHMRK